MTRARGRVRVRLVPSGQIRVLDGASCAMLDGAGTVDLDLNRGRGDARLQIFAKVCALSEVGYGAFLQN